MSIGKHGKQVNVTKGKQGFQETQRTASGKGMPVVFGLTADELEQGVQMPPLPQVEGAVTGIVSMDPPAVQCTGCGLVRGAKTIGMTVMFSGIEFNPTTRDSTKRLCSSCRLEAGQSDPTWFKGECPGCGSSHCTGNCTGRINAEARYTADQMQRDVFFTPGNEGNYMVVDTTTGTVIPATSVYVVEEPSEGHDDFFSLYEDIETYLTENDIEKVALSSAPRINEFIRPLLYDMESGTVLDIDPRSIYALDLNDDLELDDILDSTSAARAACKTSGFRLWTA
ncbi:hypothetical protein [Aeromicrobium sp. 179-A 4D2 NHS]|uniref:hypothetical protein n=1 Tax=Aeromicrobium sp. 179-A 4D2 NHS TaxID=3142375 RepID=UPI0039A24843